MDNTEGKRVMPKNGMPKGAKIAVIVIAAVLVLLVGGYLALCGYVSSSDRILPGTSADVGGDLSGMTRNQAEEAVRVAAELLYGDKVISVSYPGGSQRLSGSVVTVDAAAAADQAYARGRENGFLGLGFAWLSSHGNSLVVTAAADQNVVKSGRNIPGCEVTFAGVLNVYDVLNATKLVVDKAALATIEEVFA